jgi:endonuclease/exonuclease/phosphatase family metal-dependent hydrolase
MTWNILNGGVDGGNSSRLDRILSVITDLAPEVVVLQEAKGFDVDGCRRMHEVENALDMRGFLGVGHTDQPVLVLIRRPHPVVDCFIDSASFHHALVRLRVRLGDGSTMRVLGAHLCPDSALTRLIEAQRLANYAYVDEDVVLMGDLNSVDHHGDYRHLVAELPAHYRARHVLPAESAQLDTRVTATLEAAGFVDLAYWFGSGADRPTAPTELPSTGAEFRGMRVDYIYASLPLASRVTNVGVVVNDATAVASDHYPVVADFGLPPEKARS